MPHTLDPHADLVTLLRQLVDIESVSGNEAEIADAVEAVLRSCEHLETTRFGHTLVARTMLGRDQRVAIAGHLDTVPVANNLPSSLEEHPEGLRVVGRGSCDMKGGVAVALKNAVTITEPVHDVTWLFYECEEVNGERNGLHLLAQQHPELLEADFAVLMEPSRAGVEGGCQGSIRVRITTSGTAAHSARSWMGHNAIHDLGPVLDRLAEFKPREVEVEGLVYREGLNAVGIGGGIAGNVVPDAAHVDINYRFAPDRSLDEALQILREHFSDWELEIEDASPAARPGLTHPAAQDFLEAVGGEPGPKYGWTDTARFSAMGIPAVNYGPADARVAHADHEFCPASDLEACDAGLRRWLTGEGR